MHATPHALVFDPDAALRGRVVHALRQHHVFAGIHEAATAEEAVGRLTHARVEVLVADAALVQNGDRAILDAPVGGAPPCTVLLTTDEAWAVQAFRLGAIDYLLKPVPDTRLAQAMQRVAYHLQAARAQALGRQLDQLLQRLDEANRTVREPAFLQRVPVKEHDRIRFVDVATIAWLEAADNYVCLHVGARTHLVRATMTEMEHKLDPERFLRVHRSYIVNVDEVQALEPQSSGDCVLILRDGTRLNASRTYSDNRRRLLAV